MIERPPGAGIRAHGAIDDRHEDRPADFGGPAANVRPSPFRAEDILEMDLVSEEIGNA